jgi:PAS domain S-box-containing protein
MEQTERLIASMTEEGRYRLLVEAVTDYAIYMLDSSGFISSWNPGAERFKGYTSSEIIGQHFSRFYTEEDRKSGLPARALETAAREGKFESEGWRVRKDGSRFWAYVVIDPIRRPSGELVGFAKITRDITERRNAQEILEKAREALLQSQKMEAIGQLTGGIAHDFNNLLMAVLSSLELLRKRLPNDTKLMELLENAVQGAQRGASLTQRMLAFARQQELKQEIVDIPSLVRGMTELVRRALGPAVDVETHFPLMAQPVLADRNQLEMALLNLTVNARDAMPDGGTIDIALREETIQANNIHNLQPGRYVCLSVSDDGAGMDEETLRRATEPFFTTKGPGKGTGLGLSMVHGLAEQFGGRLTLQSRIGHGTTAQIWLPAASTQVQINEVKQAAKNVLDSSLTVLAVDDDFLVLTNTVAMLEDLGHTALSASSGQEALDVLRRHSPVDLVITDQGMPRMTGLQLFEAIRNGWPDIPVIIASGYAELKSNDGAHLEKLPKPFSETDLGVKLAEVITKARQSGGSRARPTVASPSAPDRT